jgi:hypothetical protein
MTLSLEMITVDCTDPATLAQWWAEAVGAATRSAWQHRGPEPSLDSPS